MTDIEMLIKMYRKRACIHSYISKLIIFEQILTESVTITKDQSLVVSIQSTLPYACSKEGECSVLPIYVLIVSEDDTCQDVIPVSRSQCGVNLDSDGHASDRIYNITINSKPPTKFLTRNTPYQAVLRLSTISQYFPHSWWAGYVLPDIHVSSFIMCLSRYLYTILTSCFAFD
jgi:hypothetical protein